MLTIQELASFVSSRHEYWHKGKTRAITQDYQIERIINPDAGPCVVCDKPMARVAVVQHVNHDGTEYDHHFDWFHSHVDGSDPHTGVVIDNREQSAGHIKTLCPSCKQWGTLTTTQEAYGDLTVCNHCGYNKFYDIGD